MLFDLFRIFVPLTWIFLKMFVRLFFVLAFLFPFTLNDSMKKVYRPYHVVLPGTTSAPQDVPPHIQRPPYVFNNGIELTPNYTLIKNDTEIQAIKKSCSIAKSVSDQLKSYLRVGITTEQIDRRAHALITELGAYPSPLQYNGYPKSITTSVNNIVAHGIPDDRNLMNGDIITVDISVYYKGYHGDYAETLLIGEVDADGKALVTAAREVMYAGIECCRPGVSFSKLGHVIGQESRKRGFCPLPCVGAHGVGRFLHEYPHIFQFENNYTQSEEKMRKGMVFTVEPAIGQGKWDCITITEDNWTITTLDGSRSAQFEHTILITDEGYEILTK